MKLSHDVFQSTRILAIAFSCMVSWGAKANAQGFTTDGFYVGPSIGLGFKSALGYGISSEYALTNYLGFGLDGAYYRFTESILSSPIYTASYDLSVAGLFAFGAIHPFSQSRYDPFLRIGWGYLNVNSIFTTTASPSSPQPRATYTSGFLGAFQVGLRYHFSEAFSTRVTIGFPIFLALGVDFRF
jgi:hypothetical protein